ncbi:RcpC/CpaB family pilus assembly protein [Spongisporangium articulatum]|uniref:RcpC/CpaB family pilus assembly protein n=1 Tax=Spongisporangium articulatum TaxID=3362603 RepID=A0ABW8ART6_9ACTN
MDAQRRRALQLAWWRHRRTVLAVPVALLAWVVLRSLVPGEATVLVPVVTHDLAAGAVLGADDVRPVAWPAGTEPGGLVPATTGRVLAGAMRAGEPVTDARLVGRSLLLGQPGGSVAVAVRLADAAGAALVRPGDRVDVLAARADGESAAASADPVASAALVLNVPAAQSDSAAEGGGVLGLTRASGASAAEGASAVLLLAVDRATAARLAAAQADQLLSVALLPPAIIATTLGGAPSPAP